MHVKLIMIDDEPSMLKSVSDIFSYLSDDVEHPNTYEIQEACNGVEGLEKIVSQSIDFNVILTDIKMPKMDGVTLLEKLVVIKPKIPVVIYSGHTDDDYNKKLVNEMGAFAAFTIPPDLYDLIKLVDEAAALNFENLKRKI